MSFGMRQHCVYVWWREEVKREDGGGEEGAGRQQREDIALRYPGQKKASWLCGTSNGIGIHWVEAVNL